MRFDRPLVGRAFWQCANSFLQVILSSASTQIWKVSVDRTIPFFRIRREDADDACSSDVEGAILMVFGWRLRASRWRRRKKKKKKKKKKRRLSYQLTNRGYQIIGSRRIFLPDPLVRFFFSLFTAFNKITFLPFFFLEWNRWTVAYTESCLQTPFYSLLTSPLYYSHSNNMSI